MSVCWTCAAIKFSKIISSGYFDLFDVFRLCDFLFVGGGLGLLMGLFIGSLDNPIMQSEMSGKEQFLYTAKQMGRRSWSSAKAFAFMGLIFSAAECVVEKVTRIIFEKLKSFMWDI